MSTVQEIQKEQREANVQAAAKTAEEINAEISQKMKQAQDWLSQGINMIEAAKLLQEVARLAKSQQEAIAASKQQERSSHEKFMREAMDETFTAISEYAKEHNLPAFTFTLREGFVAGPETKANEMLNGVLFNWAERSAKKTHKKSERTPRNGSLHKDGKHVGDYDSATAACKAHNLTVKVSEKTGKPAENAISVLKRHGFEWKPATPKT